MKKILPVLAATVALTSPATAGFYVGLGAGFGKLNSSGVRKAMGGTAVSVKGSGTEGIGLILCGYNFSLGNFMAGIDLMGSLKGGNINVTSGTYKASVKQNFNARLAARFGYYIIPRMLTFLSLGVTAAQGKLSLTTTRPVKAWLPALSVGAGIEVGVTSHLKLRLEYIFNGFGHFTKSSVKVAEHSGLAAVVWEF